VLSNEKQIPKAFMPVTALSSARAALRSAEDANDVVPCKNVAIVFDF